MADLDFPPLDLDSLLDESDSELGPGVPSPYLLNSDTQGEPQLSSSSQPGFSGSYPNDCDPQPGCSYSQPGCSYSQPLINGPNLHPFNYDSDDD